MKPFTKKQQQWGWFFGLWCGSLAAVFLLASLIRLLMKMS